MGKAYTVLVGKPEGKRPLAGTRYKWKKNIKIREIGLENVDWIYLAQKRDQWLGVVMNHLVP
jgi:hypothetical protein